MRKGIKKLVRRSRALTKKNKGVAAIVVCISAIIFLKHLQDIILLSLLLGLVSFAAMISRLFPARIGLEFVTLTLFITTARYGTWTGMMIGTVSLAAHIMMAGDALEKRLPSFLGIFTAVMASARLVAYSAYGVVGLALTLVFDATTMPIYYFLNARALNLITFVTTHLIFNYLIFKNLASLLLSL